MLVKKPLVADRDKNSEGSLVFSFYFFCDITLLRNSRDTG